MKKSLQFCYLSFSQFRTNFRSSQLRALAPEDDCVTGILTDWADIAGVSDDGCSSPDTRQKPLLLAKCHWDLNTPTKVRNAVSSILSMLLIPRGTLLCPFYDPSSRSFYVLFFLVDENLDAVDVASLSENFSYELDRYLVKAS